jgi:hypothetical protein
VHVPARHPQRRRPDAQLQRAWTFNRAGLDVTAATATAVTRVGIYADAVDFNFPGALIADWGTIDSSAIADPTVANVTINQTLQPGLYWLAVVAQTAAGTLRSSNPLEAINTSAPGGSALEAALVQTGVSGALPNPAVPTGDASGAVPIVYLRAA